MPTPTHHRMKVGRLAAASRNRFAVMSVTSMLCVAFRGEASSANGAIECPGGASAGLSNRALNRLEALWPTGRPARLATSGNVAPLLLDYIFVSANA